MTRKNPHAVALGRKGGKATAKRPGELSRIGKLGGRPSVYRLSPDGTFERREGRDWILLHPPYDKAARAFLYRSRRSE